MQIVFYRGSKWCRMMQEVVSQRRSPAPYKLELRGQSSLIVDVESKATFQDDFGVW